MNSVDITKVLKAIQDAMSENLETIVLMLIVVSSLYGINILFGTIIGTYTEKFNAKKFLFGVLKMILADVGIFVFCYTLNLFSLTLQLTKDITISGDFITTVEVFGILLTWAVDTAKDIVEKVKSLKELKYVTYESVNISNINDYSVDQNMKG